jgi:hypothetical protein
MSARKFVNWYRLKLDTTGDLTEVNFYRDMRGRLGEYQRMRNWCQANIGQSAESADTVDHIHVFYIGKKMSAMQFVFYSQCDFDLFNQHWDIVNHEDSSNSTQG